MLNDRVILIPVALLAMQTSFLPRAHAHQRWVLPNFFVTDTEEDTVWLGFEYTLGDQRFAPSLGPGPSMVWVTGPVDERTTPSFVFTGKTRTVAEIELKKPGTYRVATEHPEIYWTQVVDGEKKRWLRMSRDRAAGKKIETSKRYWSKTLTYVTFRTETTGPLAARGDPLELVALDHPNAIRAKQPFRVAGSHERGAAARS